MYAHLLVHAAFFIRGYPLYHVSSHWIWQERFPALPLLLGFMDVASF